MKHVAAVKVCRGGLTRRTLYAALTQTVNAADAGSGDGDVNGDVEIHDLPAPKVNGETLSLSDYYELRAVVGNDEPSTPGENDETIASEGGDKHLVMADAVESLAFDENDAAFAGLSKKESKRRDGSR
jgi:hypothetical protein